MKAIRCHLIVTAVVAMSVGMSYGEDQAEDKKSSVPPAFPQVLLSRNSQPRYTAINLDSLQNQVAYVLFDGDVTNTYKRVFVWSPGHEKYGAKPVSSLLSDETGVYCSIKTKSQVGEEGSITTWTLKYRSETHGQQYKDYKTGEMVTKDKKLVPRFYFTVDLQRGPARRADRQAGKYPLDIGISGRLSVSDSWEKLPAVAEPWKYVYCSMSRKPTYDKKRGFLRCKGHLRYHRSRWNTFPITIRNLPEDSRVSVEIAPYLEDPVYSNELGVAEIFLGHTDVDLPYGWYSIGWEFKSEFFNARGLNQSSHSWPFAFPPPAR